MPTFPSVASIIRLGLWGVVALVSAGCSGQKVGPSVPQWAADSTTVRIAAGPQYARGVVWQFFWGAHYRTLWATPVTVPVLRLASEHGGLTPVQVGGSYQSHTLRLRTTTGRQYVLRSVDKDASAALPAGWKRWLLGELMKDQTSVAQPYGAYVAAQLAGAAGVLHSNPRLVYLPNEPGLGKFRAAYANALYLLEERPEGDQRTQASFGYSPAVVNTARMLADIRLRPRAQVDARAYLRARLLDVWLGDWSRREDQWRWASFPAPGRVCYRPIPRDRDQAFFLFDDGVFTRIISWFLPKFNSFHGSIRPRTVDGLTRTARALDRTLLAPLNAADFRQVVDSLVQHLTDAAIAQALSAVPAETRAAVTARFTPLLRARRAQLRAVAQRYFEILAADAWVVGTDQAERFIVGTAGPGRLRIRLLARRPAQADSLVTERVYESSATHQVTLFGLAGNDIFEVGPGLDPAFSVAIYAGAGHNQVVPTGGVPGTLPGVIWYQGGAGEALPSVSGLAVQSDPHPELTANTAGWLKRYNLND